MFVHLACLRRKSARGTERFRGSSGVEPASDADPVEVESSSPDFDDVFSGGLKNDSLVEEQLVPAAIEAKSQAGALEIVCIESFLKALSMLGLAPTWWTAESGG